MTCQCNACTCEDHIKRTKSEILSSVIRAAKEATIKTSAVKRWDDGEHSCFYVETLDADIFIKALKKEMEGGE